MSCLEMAKEEGMEKGMEIGKEKAILTVAKSMKAKGLDIETISQCTNLSKEEIEKL